jgi:hypothetical protein
VIGKELVLLVAAVAVAALLLAAGQQILQQPEKLAYGEPLPYLKVQRDGNFVKVSAADAAGVPFIRAYLYVNGRLAGINSTLARCGDRVEAALVYASGVRRAAGEVVCTRPVEAPPEERFRFAGTHGAIQEIVDTYRVESPVAGVPLGVSGWCRWVQPDLSGALPWWEVERRIRESWEERVYVFVTRPDVFMVPDQPVALRTGGLNLGPVPGADYRMIALPYERPCSNPVDCSIPRVSDTVSFKLAKAPTAPNSSFIAIGNRTYTARKWSKTEHVHYDYGDRDPDIAWIDVYYHYVYAEVRDDRGRAVVPRTPVAFCYHIRVQEKPREQSERKEVDKKPRLAGVAKFRAKGPDGKERVYTASIEVWYDDKGNVAAWRTTAIEYREGAEPNLKPDLLVELQPYGEIVISDPSGGYSIRLVQLAYTPDVASTLLQLSERTLGGALTSAMQNVHDQLGDQLFQEWYKTYVLASPALLSPGAYTDAPWRQVWGSIPKKFVTVVYGAAGGYSASGGLLPAYPGASGYAVVPDPTAIGVVVAATYGYLPVSIPPVKLPSGWPMAGAAAATLADGQGADSKVTVTAGEALYTLEWVSPVVR